MSGIGRPSRVPGPDSGQSLVEFTLMLPLFLFMVFAIVDGGRMVYANAALSQAAREGARVAAAEAGWVGVPGTGCVTEAASIGEANRGAHVCPADVAALATHVADAANGMVVAVGPLRDVYLSCNADDAHDPVPSGDWTSVSGGNGCSDGSGAAVSSAGDVISVRVLYEFAPTTPILSNVFGRIELSAAASMVIH